MSGTCICINRYSKLDFKDLICQKRFYTKPNGVVDGSSVVKIKVFLNFQRFKNEQYFDLCFVDGDDGHKFLINGP